jgi:hypothetical protein
MKQVGALTVLSSDIECQFCYCSCHLCHSWSIMLFMVKYDFLGLQRQLRCQAEGKQGMLYFATLSDISTIHK